MSGPSNKSTRRALLLLFSVAMVTQQRVLGLKFDQIRDLEVNAAASPGTIVGRLRVTASSPDEEIGYALHNTTDSTYFNLDEKTGLLTTSKILDRAVNATYHIIVRATSVRTRNMEHGRFDVRVTAPSRPSDPSRLLFDQDEYRGAVEADGTAGSSVIRTMAFINGSTNSAMGNITYFMEPMATSTDPSAPSDELVKQLFRMETRTGVVRLLRSSPGAANFRSRNVTFVVGAREAGRALETRAAATVLIHGLSRPRGLTVTKLSAISAVICWKFPAKGGAHGYLVRYWKHPGAANLSDDDPAGAVPVEMKMMDMSLRDTANATSDEERTVCSNLKPLEPEAAYKVQVSAWRRSLNLNDSASEWTGPASAVLHFTTQTNQCLLNDTCATGECVVSTEPPGFECLCHSGHYGARCELYDPCVLSPCQHGASCQNNTNGTYRCSCAVGYAGDNCTILDGPNCLRSEPCLNNGTCVNETGCVCPQGYEGSQCQSYNPCWNDPCRNGATCTRTDSSDYLCVCPAGYRGLDCEEEIDYCVLDPCKNDGNCTSRDGTYHCECVGGYHGVDCEQDVDECQQNPCHNGSTCRNVPGSFACTCPPGFTGPLCDEEELDDCSLSPCQNKGVCQNGPTKGDYTCFCRPGFTGRDCEVDIDDCTPDPCANGATCIDLVDAFECVCPAGYQGLRCDHEEQCPEEVEATPTKGTFYWPALGPGETAAVHCPHGPARSSASRSRRSAAKSHGQLKDDEYRGGRQRGPSRLWRETARLKRQEKLKQGANGTVFAVRSCERTPEGLVRWMGSDLSLCREQSVAEAEAKSSQLEQEAAQLNAVRLEKVADQVENLVEYAIVDPKVAQNLFHALSNVLEADEQVLGAASDSCERLLEAVERFTSEVPLELGQPVVLATPNIAVETVLIDASQESYSFRPSFEDDADVDQPVALTIPKEALEEYGNETVRLQFVSYRSGKFFQSRRHLIPGQPSLVLSATVGHRPVYGLYEPVVYSMPLAVNSSFYSCVYWNETEKEWSTSGITTRKTEQGTIECSSNHLTAFSILLDPTPLERIAGFHERILRLISYIGSGLSILGLSITVLLYSLFRNLRRDRGGKILLNLSISLLMLNIVFLVGSIMGTAFRTVDAENKIEQLAPDRVFVAGAEPTPTVSQAQTDVCMALTVAVHYLILTSLSWMLVEAVHMYQLLILVFANSETFFMLKRLLAAWGIPLAIVITTVVLQMEYYQDPSGLTCGRMSPKYPAVYYGSFIGPTCLIVLINLSVFFLVLRVILMQGQRGRAVGKVSENGRGANGSNRLVTMAQLRGAVTVMALLGVTWLAGALAVGPLKLVMSYVFCVCNSLQGFVIFIVRVVQYPEARQSWITLWNTGQTHIPYEGTRHSTGGPTTNSSGSAGNHSSAQGHARVRKTFSSNSTKSPGSGSGNRLPMHHVGRNPDDSLTPSQAPTLPIGSNGNSPSLSNTYPHWFANSGSPASNGSTQSRFRRIFGQLGLEPASLRLTSKQNGKSGPVRSHSLLERHVSGATNPPPSPGEKAHELLNDAVAPEELAKPHFLIGEEISLLNPSTGLVETIDVNESSVSARRASLQSLSGVVISPGLLSKEGAHTSWTFLRPEDDEPSAYRNGKGSVPALKAASEFVGRRRSVSTFVVNLPSYNGSDASSETERRCRTMSLSRGSPDESLDASQHRSLPCHNGKTNQS